MGKAVQQFNKFMTDYRKSLKKPLRTVASLMESGFTDDEFLSTFIRLYPHLWDDIKMQYIYWHIQNSTLQKYGKKSRYHFPKPTDFIMNCSETIRIGLRSSKSPNSFTREQRLVLEASVISDSHKRLQRKQNKVLQVLHYIQEIEPKYAPAFIDWYFKTHDLHEKLEIIRELSKYKSENIISFFYKVNACMRNFSLKEESMHYIQGLGLPFRLRPKKKGKTNFIDNEIVKNESMPEVLHKRLFVNKLERLKVFDVFISHNSKDEDRIVTFYKALNSLGYVAYIDWVNDKYDLKREWCNATTAKVIKERIKQSHVFILYLSQQTLSSQWCPWELGYADALGKNICVCYEIEDHQNIPDFYKTYPQLILSEKPHVIVNGSDIPFKDWMNTQRIASHD